MPLDKSRIQGFGSDGAAGNSESTKITTCPQGHRLASWQAKQGWCDQCGRRVLKGERVMDCRQCNWYLCTTCCPQPGLSSASDWSSGGIASALDSFALQVGDAIDAAAADMAEMANDVKDFVVEAMGGPDDEESTTEDFGRQRTHVDVGSLQHRQAAVQAISSFCNNYPAARVAPKAEELEALWDTCEKLGTSPMTHAIYEQLSYSSGEFEWQPRLRTLYILEFLYAKGGHAKEIAVTVGNQTDGLLQPLLEVQQCKTKASKVIVLLLGKAKATEAGIDVTPEMTKAEVPAATGAAKAKSQAKAKAKAEPVAAAKKEVQDLLDLAAPEAAPPAPKAAAAPKGAAADLMDLTETPVAVAPAAQAPPAADLDLFAAAPAASAGGPAAAAATDLFGGFAASAPATSSGGSFDPNAFGAGAAPGAAVPAAPSALSAAVPPPAAPTAAAPPPSGVANGPAMPLRAAAPPQPMGFAAFGMAAPYPSMPPMAPAAGAAPLAPARPMGGATAFGGPCPAPGTAAGAALPAGAMGAMGVASGAVRPPAAGAKAGAPYIPPASALTPLHNSSPSNDPFAFVTDITGLGK